MIRSSQRPLPNNTQHSQHTNIHAPGGIRTHNLSRRAAADLRLRPRGHWDRHSTYFTFNYSLVILPFDDTQANTSPWLTRYLFKALWYLQVTPALTLKSTDFFPPSAFLCFVQLLQQTGIMPLNSINWLVFVMTKRYSL